MKLKDLQTKFLGRNNIYFEKIDSTQKEIWRLYEKGAPNGTLVFADIQESGIGTHGRIWYTTEKNNIAFSFLIKTNCNISNLDGLTSQIAKTIIDIFKDKYNISLSIKEPNDIVYNFKKIGGILTQTKLTEETVNVLVIGIGINTNQNTFVKDINNIATSIKKEFKVSIDNKDFIKTFCERFEKIIFERNLIR